MRPVKFNTWIRPIYENDKKKQGTGCYDTGFKSNGLFIGFSYEFSNDIGVIVAIIEKHDGTVVEIHTSQLRFVNLQLYHKYRIMGIFKGFQIDEIITAENRETAIEIMEEKYPGHVFEYVSELI